MDTFERIRELRKNHLHLSQEEFGKRLGVSRSVINNMERNVLARPDQKEPLLKLICREFDVNEEWMRTGEGEIFLSEDEDAQTASLVFELLKPEEHGLYELILEIIRTYQELSPNSQQVIRESCVKLLENLKRRDDR